MPKICKFQCISNVPGFQPAERIAVAVLDHQHVVCVQSKADAVYTLPIADIGKNTTRTHIGLKKRASEHIRFSVNILI